MTDKRQVVVIGLDGASWDILRPRMERGQMPCLKQLADGGAVGDLESVCPPETPAAWPSYMTGTNPGKHGVFDFIVYDPKTKRDYPVNAKRRAGKTVQDYLTEAGKTSLVLNVPTTYPPAPIQGALISGFLTPADARDYAHPVELVAELEAEYGTYPLFFNSMSFVSGLSDYNCRVFMEELEAMDRTKFEVAEKLMERYQPDYTMLHIWGTDRLQHELWHMMDEAHPKYNPAMAKKWGPRIDAYYAMVDERVGRIAQKLGPDSVVFVISDHGFGPTHHFIDLNSWLLREGFIVLKDNWRVRLKKLLWNLGITPQSATRLVWPFLRYLSLFNAISPERSLRKATGALSVPGMLSLKTDVDWARTRAYAPAGWSGIFINTEGIRPNGSVPPADYEAVRDAIVARWAALKNPETGVAVGGPVHVNQDLYNGPFSPYGPDVMPLPLEANYMPVCFFGFTSKEPVYRNVTLFGNHRMEGILLAHGGGVRPGTVEGARLIDLAPTILHLLGEPVREHFDGRVIEGLLDDAERARGDASVVSGGPDDAVGNQNLSDDEEDELRKRLEKLGYL